MGSNAGRINCRFSQAAAASFAWPDNDKLDNDNNNVLLHLARYNAHQNETCVNKSANTNSKASKELNMDYYRHTKH